MPPGVPYIVANEAAERFGFYGMRAILVVFMTQYLRASTGELAVMSENEANRWYHVFVATNYFFPILGAIVADLFLGKYRTIFSLSLLYCLGHATLALGETRLTLAVGLTLIAMGAGGIKACVSANLGDQFSSDKSSQLASAYAWFVFAINAASFVSLLLIPWLLEHSGPHVAFGLPGILMLVATGIFRLGRDKFIHIPPEKTEFYRSLTAPATWSALRGLIPVYAFVAIFWALWDQSGSEWVLQAKKMNLTFLGITWLPAQILAANTVLMLLLIPLFQYVVYPAVGRIAEVTPARKIGAGLAITGSAFLVSAWIETRIHAGLTPSIAWQLAAFALLTAGEVLVSITALGLAYTRAPARMKSVFMAVYLLSVSAGNAFTAMIHFLIENPDGTSRLEGAAYYGFYAILAIVCAALFLVFMREKNLQPATISPSTPA